MSRGWKILVKLICALAFGFVFVCLFFTKLDRNVSDYYDFSGRTLVGDYVGNLPLLVAGAVLLAAAYAFCRWRSGGKLCLNRGKPCLNRGKPCLDRGKPCLDRGKPCPDKGFSHVELLVCSVVLFALQAAITYNIYMWAGTDTSVMRIAASNFVEGRWDEYFNRTYFQMCPNNLLLYGINVLFLRLGRALSVNGFLLLMWFGVALVNLAVLFTALVVRRITGSSGAARAAYLLAALLFGLSPWMTVPYSDTLSVLAPILTLYLYLRLRDAAVPPFWKYLGIMAVPAVSYLIKPLNAIILIAIALVELLFFICRRGGGIEKRNLFSLAGAALAVLLLVFGTRQGASEYLRYQPDDSLRMPIGYYLVLGFNDETYGTWSQKDVDYMLAARTQEEKHAAAARRVGERLKKMGVVGCLNHWKNKVHFFYDDATFGWGLAGGFFDAIPEEPNDTASPFLRNLFYPYAGYSLTSISHGYGKYYGIYAVAVQFVWVNVLCLGFLALFLADGQKPLSAGGQGGDVMAGRKVLPEDKRRAVWVVAVSLVGVFLFDMLFETSARLMYSQLPVFVAAAGVTLDALFCRSRNPR